MSDHPSLPPDGIEELCQAFHNAWQRDSSTRIESYIDEAASSDHVRELVEAEIDLRRSAGESPTVPEYMERFPKYRELIERAFARGDETHQIEAPRDTSLSLPVPPTPEATLVAVERTPHEGSGTDAKPESEIPLSPAGYEFVEELARGGMGIVYRARDRHLDREVAIKLIHGRYASDTEATTRFMAESQVTGRLQHPGIPPVHELGVLPDGRPYLAMKLIQGRTLAEILKDAENPSSSDRARLVAVFEQICQAVGYAHSHGVIHRDLKPSNVMVGAFGEVQVMDWGLAKLLETIHPEANSETAAANAAPRNHDWHPAISGSSTQTGAILGTPAFMAPEQAAGLAPQMDTRTDVFGLGAILCTILTGQSPYGDGSANRLFKRALDGDTRVSQQALELCQADPELISLCRRCLAKQQDDRPEDGAAVANEVARIRQEAEQRAQKAQMEHAESVVREAEQAKRRRLQRLGSVALISILALGAAGTAIGLFEAQKQQRIASHQRDEAITARNQATELAASERQAKLEAETQKATAENRLTQIERGNEILAGIFEELDVFKVREGKTFETALADRLLIAAEQLKADAVGEAASAVTLRSKLGFTLVRMGQLDAGIEILQQTYADAKRLHGETHVNTLGAGGTLATAYLHLFRSNEALDILEVITPVYREVLGDQDSTTLNTMSNLANAYQQVNRHQESVNLLRDVLFRTTMLYGPDDQNSMTCMGNLAVALGRAGRYDQSIPLLEHLVKKWTQRIGEDHPETLIVMSNLATAYLEYGQVQEARLLAEKNVRLRVERLGEDHPDVLIAKQIFARTLVATGELDRAIELFDSLEPRYIATYGPTHGEALAAMANRARAYQAGGRTAEAVEILQRAIPSGLSPATPAFATVLDSAETLGHLYWQLGDFPAAADAFKKSAVGYEALYGSDSEPALRTTAEYAGCLHVMGDSEAAIPALEKAYAGITEFPGLQWVDVHLLFAHGKLGNTRRVLEVANETLHAARSMYPEGSDQLASALGGCAWSLKQCGEYQSAEPLLRECLEIRTRLHPDRWNIHSVRSALGAVLSNLGKHDEAAPLLVSGYEGLAANEEDIPKEWRRLIAEAARDLADYHSAQGDEAEALIWKTTSQKKAEQHAIPRGAELKDALKHSPESPQPAEQ